MKKVALAIIAVALMGCASEVDGVVDSAVVHHTETINGTTVDCILYDGYNAGGLSCNWEAYNDLRTSGS